MHGLISAQPLWYVTTVYVTLVGRADLAANLGMYSVIVGSQPPKILHVLKVCGVCMASVLAGSTSIPFRLAMCPKRVALAIIRQNIVRVSFLN